MAEPNELLANSLEALQKAEVNGIVRTEGLSNRHRQRLLKAGFLAEIIKGWYRVNKPEVAPGQTAWYPFYWEFVAQYLKSRFADAYCLSAESSLLIHAGSTSLPSQLIVLTGTKLTQTLNLPSELSIFMYGDPDGIPTQPDQAKGLRIMPMAEALARVPEGFYRNRSVDAAVILRRFPDVSPVLSILLDGGKSHVAGRLAGAFRACHQPDHADQILSTMRRLGYEVTESNPFLRPIPMINAGRNPSPYGLRVRTLWAEMREQVLAHFPDSPGLPTDPEAYMKSVQDAYAADAYNSLSIEGYRVTAELIEKVRQGNWRPDGDPNDRASQDALAARGYYEAFQSVKRSVEAIVKGGGTGQVRRDHRDWYQSLFAPSVQAGILKATELAGYRNHPVFIKGSHHVPPPAEGVMDAMATLFDLIEEEPGAPVRAVLGHFIFVFIHPYGDGNGRTGRFLMNAMLASGGYPWTVVRVERRAQYMAALEEASVRQNIAPFTQFLAEELASSNWPARVRDLPEELLK